MTETDIKDSIKPIFLIMRLFKFVYDTIIFSLSSFLFSSDLCSNIEARFALLVYYFAIVLPIFFNSLVELIVYLHKLWKKLLIQSLTCDMTKEMANDTKKEKDSKLAADCCYFLIGIPFSLLYLACYLVVSFLRFIDIRQCFWKKKYYYNTFIISYVCQLIAYFYAIGTISSALYFHVRFFPCSNNSSTESSFIDINSALNSSTEPSTNSALNSSTDSSTKSGFMVAAILTMILIIFRIVKRSIYFFQFQYFIPSGLEKAHNVLHTNQSNRVSTIMGQINSNQDLVCIGARKQMPFFPEKYLFMPQLLRIMRIRELGSMGCLASTSCTSVDLEHIVLCHNELNIPNEKCRCCYDCTSRKGYLVGFHQTDPEAALCIAMSPMRQTKAEISWYGSGIYFARRFDDTHRKIGKEGGRGALIVALINMKRVKHLRSREDNTGNDPNFDSIYVAANSQGKNSPSKDEFLVYNDSQIEQIIVCI